jgi:hypothetical protein
MTTTATRRRTALAALLAMILAVMTALPALAADPTSTSRLLAGGEQLANTLGASFRIEVNYPAAAGLNGVTDPKLPVNAVLVVGPNTVTGLDGTTAMWNDRQLSGNRLLFDGNVITPGSTVNFDLTGNVGQPPFDVTRPFDVFLSTDGGNTFTQSTDNGLAVTTRVLEAKNVTLVRPAAAFNPTANQVTTAQDNALVTLEVTNRGAEAGTGRTGIVTRGELRGPAGFSATQQGDPQNIPYGETRTFTFSTVFPNTAGNATLIGDAVSTETGLANARDAAPLVITVQQALQLTYQANSLSPLAFNPEPGGTAAPQSLRATFNRAGQVSARFDKPATTITLGGIAAGLATPDDVAVTAPNVELTFASTDYSSLVDGNYTPTVAVRGTDWNGANVSLAPGPLPAVKIDRLIPNVAPILSGIATFLQDPEPNEQQVATNGTTLTFSGPVTESNSSSASCPDCVVVAADLIYNDTIVVPLTPGTDIRINNGQLAGSKAVDQAGENITSVRLRVQVRDAAGNTSGLNGSGLVVVDNVTPSFVTGDAGSAPAGVTVANPRRTITLFLNESVRFPAATGLSPLSFYVDNFTVTEARGFRFARAGESAPVQGSGHVDFVVLTLSGDMGPEGVPQVRYAPDGGNPGSASDLLGNRARDQVRKAVANQLIDIVDRIAPDLPILNRVNDRIEQSGSFWTNRVSTAVPFQVANVLQGDVVQVFVDGVQRGSATKNNDGEFVTVDVTLPSAADGNVFEVAVRVLDEVGNISPIAEEIVTVDLTAPGLANFTKSGRVATVKVNELLSGDPAFQGTNSAIDWYGIEGSGFFARTWQATSVAHGSLTDTIEVTLAQGAANVTLSSMNYDFQPGSESKKRYEDRAGNVLESFLGIPPA